MISPEGCASILWRDQAQATIAAEALKLTAEDSVAVEFGWTGVVPEPLGGAQRDKLATIQASKSRCRSCWRNSKVPTGPGLRSEAAEKFLAMGREPVA